MVNSRYMLHEAIGEGAMGVIYRAYDRLDRQVVALKRVKPDPLAASDSPSQSNQRHYLTTITQEFQLLSSLRHPNIISVLDYGVDADKTPYYVMELLIESETILAASQQESFNQRIHYLIDTLQALEYLHRRGILHRDLKPANILITGEKTVKVLDFGLATFKQADNITALSGTLAYMPPEVLKGAGAVEQSDLYSLGILAYQMFVGKHPFDSQDVNKMIYETVSSPPPLDPLAQIHPQLAVIIGQLLEKSPDARYLSAYAVIVALSSLIQTDTPAESLAVRESFLQASQLIGREVEMNELMTAYRQSKTESVRLIFIYGESGVGKSRLLDEVRIRVLIDNSLVLRGYANSNELHPFGIWREPLRQLCLMPNLIDDISASILKPLIPDIEALLNRRVADAPPLSGMADLNRLVDVIVQVILAQAERSQTVILLEDVHDAPDALPILRQLNTQNHKGLLVVATSQPTNTFYKQLNADEAVTIELARLNSDQIAELLENMVGSNSKRPEVVQLLEQETEGNIFFLIETLKVLAEDAGTLSQIGNTTLPQSIFAGGVQKLVDRRLERIPKAGRALLGVMAVAGRFINLELAKFIGQLDNEGLAQWLGWCSDATVLRVVDDQWQFAHEKLRQRVIMRLSDEEKRVYHQMLGHGLEAVTDDSGAIARLLVHHFYEGGVMSDFMRYLPTATQQAQAICDYHEVLRLCDLASQRSPALYKLQGDAYEGLGVYDAAQEAYQAVLDHPQSSPTEKIGALNGISALHWRRNRYDSSLAYAQEAMNLARQAGDKFGEATALNNLGIIASDTGQFHLSKGYYEAGLALRREIGDLQGEGYILNSLGIASMDQSDYVQARAYFEAGMTLSAKIGNRHEVAFAKHGLSHALCELGDHVRAVEEAQDGLRIARELGNLRGIALCAWRFATAQGFITRQLVDADGFGLALRLAEFIGDKFLQVRILADKARILALMGDTTGQDEALKLREVILGML